MLRSKTFLMPRLHPRSFSLFLLFVFTLLSFGAKGYAQKQIIPLRSYDQMPPVEGWLVSAYPDYYFEDQHHDLDKFAGEWKGVGPQGHQWQARIAVFKKVKNNRGEYMDLLGLELSITKEGEACVTPTEDFVPNTPYLMGDRLVCGLDEREAYPDVYAFTFSYRGAEEQYRGTASKMILRINPTHDEIVVHRSFSVAFDPYVPAVPDYLLGEETEADVCTLRRVSRVEREKN